MKYFTEIYCVCVVAEVYFWYSQKDLDMML